MMGRTLVIGDIHGGLKAVEQVLHKAAVASSDKLVFLGDYVDGWSQSAQTINFLIQLSQKQSCVFIKGNHDAWTEEWLRTGNTNSAWLSSGGKETISSYEFVASEERQQHLNFFKRMQLFYIDEQNRLFIHAGFTSMHGPQQEFYNSNFTWDRTLWEMALTMDKRIKKDSLLYPKRLKLFQEVFIGHTPTLNYNIAIPMQGCNVWNIDTGAAFTGPLTILNADTKEFWQSEPVKNFYPDERGRNRD